MDSNAGRRASSPLRTLADCDAAFSVITHHLRHGKSTPICRTRGRSILIRNDPAHLTERGREALDPHLPNVPSRCRSKETARFSRRQIITGFGSSPRHNPSHAVKSRACRECASSLQRRPGLMRPQGNSSAVRRVITDNLDFAPRSHHRSKPSSKTRHPVVNVLGTCVYIHPLSLELP